MLPLGQRHVSNAPHVRQCNFSIMRRVDARLDEQSSCGERMRASDLLEHVLDSGRPYMTKLRDVCAVTFALRMLSDYDGDGWVDVLFANAAEITGYGAGNPRRPLARLAAGKVDALKVALEPLIALESDLA